MALSLDLRRRMVDLVGSGVSRREAARRFQVSASSANRLARQNAEVGHAGAKKRKRRRSRLDPFGNGVMSWTAQATHEAAQAMDQTGQQALVI